MGNQPSNGGGGGGGLPQPGVSPKSKRSSLHDNMIRVDGKNRKSLQDKYDVVEQALGSGTSTQIRQVTLKKYTKTSRTDNNDNTNAVAIKLYDGKSTIPPDLKLEASILSQCDHPSIVRLYETTKVNKRLSLVMELCTGGKLSERMPYTENRVAQIIKQVCSAVTYLVSFITVLRLFVCLFVLQKLKCACVTKCIYSIRKILFIGILKWIIYCLKHPRKIRM